MIKFRLQCDNEHAFDVWFASGASFDQQVERRLVDCPSCGSTAVAKAPMAPNVVTKAAARRAQPEGPREEAGAEIAAPDDARGGRALAAMPMPVTDAQREMLAMMRRVRDEVMSKAENVGPRFVEEVRKIHHDEAPNRGIYGEASLDDARALIEEGIEVMPLPMLPEDRN